jgi:methylenetetrahydrofolate dehydrogenase (NADP+)/methenyltetrahydrofolate cyclohydrolase
MTQKEDVLEAIANGKRGRHEIAETVGLSPSQTGRRLREMLDAGTVYREKDGRFYKYHVADRPGHDDEAAAVSDDGQYRAPVDRSYNFEDEVPDDVHEYVPTNGEWDAMNAIIDARESMGTLPRILIAGPSGNGKTTAAENVAEQRAWPFFEVSMSNAIYEADLLGTTNVVGGDTVWEDGPITKALLSSRERPTVLLVDEVNRAMPEVLNVLFPVLDDRCRVELTGGRGGEEITGDPSNLIVVGTINEGREYHGTQEMDHALKRRFKYKYETAYLGENFPEKEAALVTGRTPAHLNLAEEMVTAANDVRELAADPEVNGILLQHPVPEQVDERAAFEAIPPEKDVDGTSLTSFGAMWFGLPGFNSCTPGGMMKLLDTYGVELKGKHAVIVGRSAILGKPMAGLLLNRHATVTMCHSRTADLPGVVRQAEIVVAAVGKPRFVQGDWIKEGAVVLDAGFNPGNVGDVDFDTAAERASMITPVPGGVGPMTIATLLEQTAEAVARQWQVDG